MPQSFAAMYVHVVFSTKHRAPSIDPEWADRLYEYIGGIVANRRGMLLAAGGMPNHVHLISLPLGLTSAAPLGLTANGIVTRGSAALHPWLLTVRPIRGENQSRPRLNLMATVFRCAPPLAIDGAPRSGRRRNAKGTRG